MDVFIVIEYRITCLLDGSSRCVYERLDNIDKKGCRLTHAEAVRMIRDNGMHLAASGRYGKVWELPGCPFLRKFRGRYMRQDPDGV